MKVFYFTATGNSLAIAKHIGGELISIPQVISDSISHYKDDIIGVVFPIYGFAPPNMVRTFLDKVKLEADYIFAIGTYGNSPGACMMNVQKRAKANGYRFDYANSILMVDNYLPGFEIDAQMKKLPEKKTEEKTAEIIHDIQNRKHMQARPSAALRVLTPVIYVMARLLMSPPKSPRQYIVTDACTKCGLCERSCPTKNISVTDQVHFSDHCEACYACLHICPQNALHHKSERSAKRWRNAEVSVKEIIDSNNRS